MSVPPTKEAALVKAEKLIRQAVEKSAKIICLPELFNTPYFPQKPKADVEEYCEPIPGETTKVMSTLARELKVIIIVPMCERAIFPLPRRGEGQGRGRTRYYNTAIVINDDGKLLGKYRKNHIPHDPGFYEKDYFTEGDLGYKIFTTKFAKFAVLICYDQWFPEAARAARLAGAEVIFYPTAVGNIVGYRPEGDWHDAWETAQRGHAIVNSVHVATVNRVGREGRMTFFGQSFVSDPFGKIMKRASTGRDEAVVLELDLSRNQFFAEGWGFLRNRRPDTYQTLTSGKLVEKHRRLKKVPHYRDEIRALEK